jgi:hypothetical protein
VGVIGPLVVILDPELLLEIDGEGEGKTFTKNEGNLPLAFCERFWYCDENV